MNKLQLSHIGVLVGKACLLHCLIFFGATLLFATGSLLSIGPWLTLIDNPIWHTVFLVMAILFAAYEFLAATDSENKNLIRSLVGLGSAFMMVSFFIELSGSHHHHSHEHLEIAHAHIANHLLFVLGNVLIVVGHFRSKRSCCGGHSSDDPSTHTHH